MFAKFSVFIERDLETVNTLTGLILVLELGALKRTTVCLSIFQNYN